MLRFLPALVLPILMLRVVAAGEPEAMEALRKAGAQAVLDGNKAHVIEVRFTKKEHGDSLLDAIADCKELRQILISSSAAVTDNGLAKFKNFAKLDQLTVNHPGITDKGVERISECRNLKTLNLSGTKITDASAALLKKLDKLEILSLNVTDAGNPLLSEIAGLPKLKGLQLGGTKVDDEGFESLAKMKALQNISLGGSKVTAAGVEKFSKDHPEVKVGFPRPKKK